jgi:plasmid stabilization system protein ParE
MTRSLRIVALARTDVERIFDWLVHRSVRGAVAWYLAFLESVDRITHQPEMFGEAPESIPLRRQLRQSLFKTSRGRTYRIVFELTDNEIILLRVRGPGQPGLKKRQLPDA